MSQSIDLLLTVLYKVVPMVIGLFFGLLGYRLFRLGFVEEGGDLKAQFGENGFTLGRAAPGTFFATLGALVIVSSVVHGLDFQRQALSNGAAGREIMKAPRGAAPRTNSAGRVSKPPKAATRRTLKGLERSGRDSLKLKGPNVAPISGTVTTIHAEISVASGSVLQAGSPRPDGKCIARAGQDTTVAVFSQKFFESDWLIDRAYSTVRWLDAECRVGASEGSP